jgi:HSP20 family protein
MIDEDMPEVFRQMDVMMARLLHEMESGFSTGLQPGTARYHIVIQGRNLPPENGGFGTISPRDRKEPLAEVHRIGDEVKVIVELPGLTDDSIRLDIQGDRLIIDAGDADRHYNTAVALPPVDPVSMQKSLRNGVLEVTFTILPDILKKEGNAEE